MHEDGVERGRLLSEMAGALRRLEHHQAHNRGVELIDPRSARRDARRAWLKHWASPGANTPWWLFIVDSASGCSSALACRPPLAVRAGTRIASQPHSALRRSAGERSASYVPVDAQGSGRT